MQEYSIILYPWTCVVYPFTGHPFHIEMGFWKNNSELRFTSFTTLISKIYYKVRKVKCVSTYTAVRMLLRNKKNRQLNWTQFISHGGRREKAETENFCIKHWKLPSTPHDFFNIFYIYFSFKCCILILGFEFKIAF